MKRKYVYLYLLGLLLFSVACTGNFRDYNTDLSGITDDDLIIDDNGYGIRLGIIQQGIYFNYDYGKGKNWPFQLIQNLNADMFSGYMHDGKPLNGGSHNSDYNMQDGWNSAMWTHMYSYIFPQIYQSENATRNTHPALFGITKILKVEAMHRVTDYYGPIIYKNFANAEKHYRPDKQDAEIQKIKENDYGFFEAETGGAIVSTKSGYTNPLGELNRVWNETYMSANMESILVGYDDPRLGAYFEHCTDEALKGQYRGIRQGTCFAHSHYSGLSKLFVLQSTDAPLMTASEVWFLRAEAALRGWTDEDEEACYRNGVTTSFHQWGIYGVEDYLKSELTASDFIDTYDEENNIEARCKVTPKWNPQDDKETKLEKIITQKWIAMFSEGCEAWAEQRRTGYPRLFPVRFNHSRSGCIDTEIMVRRLNFPGTLQTEDPEQYSALVEALGGDDHGGTRLWWDTGNNNLE